MQAKYAASFETKELMLTKINTQVNFALNSAEIFTKISIKVQVIHLKAMSSSFLS